MSPPCAAAGPRLPALSPVRRGPELVHRQAQASSVARAPSSPAATTSPCPRPHLQPALLSFLPRS
jgi:hypothetical protein